MTGASRTAGRKRTIRKLSAVALLILTLAAALLTACLARRQWLRAPVRTASDTQAGDSTHLYPMKAGDKWGYIDGQGHWVIPARYAYAQPFSDGVALVEYPGMCLVSHTHSLPSNACHVMAWQGLIDPTGKALTDVNTGVVGTPSEGLAAAVRTRDCLVAGLSDGLKGFVDTEGKWQIEPAFEDVGHFSEGLAWAREPGVTCGYIDRAGHWAIVPQFEAAADFHDGLARVWIASGVAFVDRAGNLIVVPEAAEEACDFSEGLASARYRDESGEGIGFITKSGEWAFKVPDADGCWDGHGFREGLAPLGKDGLLGYIDKSGQWQIPPIFRHAGPFYEGLAAVTEQSGRAGYIDHTGKLVFELSPPRGVLDSFRNGLAPIGVEFDVTGSYIVHIEGYVRADGSRVEIEWEMGARPNERHE